MAWWLCEAAINKPESAGEAIALEFFNSSTSDVVVPAKTAAAVLVKAPTMMYRQDDPDIGKAELLGNIVTSAVSEISVLWMSVLNVILVMVGYKYLSAAANGDSGFQPRGCGGEAR